MEGQKALRNAHSCTSRFSILLGDDASNFYKTCNASSNCQKMWKVYFSEKIKMVNNCTSVLHWKLFSQKFLRFGNLGWIGQFRAQRITDVLSSLILLNTRGKIFTGGKAKNLALGQLDVRASPTVGSGKVRRTACNTHSCSGHRCAAMVFSTEGMCTMNACRLGCRPPLKNTVMDVWEKDRHPFRSGLATARLEIPGLQLTPGWLVQSTPWQVSLSDCFQMSSSWRFKGPSPSERSGSDTAKSFFKAEMDTESSCLAAAEEKVGDGGGRPLPWKCCRKSPSDAK